MKNRLSSYLISQIKKINEDKNNINKNNKNNKNNEYILKKTNTIDPGIYYRNTHENFFEENKVNNKWAFSTLMHKINLNNNNIDKKSKIDSILSQHKKNMRSKKNYTLMKATQLKEQKKEIVNKIKSYETDLKIFREEKNKIKNELLSHYNTILHEGKDIRKDGLSWIIQAIWNLKCKVLPSYLPIFLDEESIKFLFNFANKKNKRR